MKKDDQKQEFDLSDVLGGTLNFFGFKVDLAKLLASPEATRAQLEELRERLKQLGGKEVLTDQEWRSGVASVSGHVVTRGIVGEREYHIGTSSPRGRTARPQAKHEPPEVVEPALDLFDEGHQVIIVADVPGTALEDLDIKVQGNLLSLSTRSTARRPYRKAIELSPDVEPESLQASCRNGVLEIRLRKRAGGGPKSDEAG